MVAYPDLGSVAGLIADPTRAAILVSLFDGRARTAGELAAHASVSPQAASNHLSKLLEGGLLALEAQGRHRYYRLAGPEVAHALEALAALRPAVRARPDVPAGLRFARICYDHLAGGLGVAITRALLEQGHLVTGHREFELTPRGETWFTGLGVDVSGLRQARRPMARRCLDWSERQPHLAGALGAALLGRLFEAGWVARIPGGRAVRLTVNGKLALERKLGLALPVDDA